MPPINFKKVYLWHLSGHHWDKLMEKYGTISKSLGAVHQRFLDKRNQRKSRRSRRPLGGQDSGNH